MPVLWRSRSVFGERFFRHERTRRHRDAVGPTRALFGRRGVRVPKRDRHRLISWLKVNSTPWIAQVKENPGSGTVWWGETPGEPPVGRTFRFSAREDARPTPRLAKLHHHQNPRLAIGRNSGGIGSGFSCRLDQ